jgi:hypothetical protein
MSSVRLAAGGGFAASAIFFWWFLAGASLIALVDRVTTTRHAQPDSPTRFYFDDGKDSVLPTDPKLAFGSREWSISESWHVVERPTGHLTLETPQGNFALGLLVNCQNMGRGRRAFEVTPEPGDSVSYTQRRSRVWWPRPFNIAWLGGRVSSRSRYVYHRLFWRKQNGAVLDMVWRDDQHYTKGQGWMDSYLPWPPRASIRLPK